MRSNSTKAIAGMALLAGGMAVTIAAETLKGDPAKAEPLVASLCASCHGQDGNSPVPNFPNLAGQHAEYLLREMKDFKTEHRQSEVMAPFIAALKEEDLVNLAVYFAKQKPVQASVTRPELVALGKKIYLDGNSKSGVPSCDGCHEEDGSGSARFPRLAGQNPEYTVDAMKLYAHGKRTNGVKVMRTVAERMTEQEMQAVAQYLASLK
jgi:cytochrome c553